MSHNSTDTRAVLVSTGKEGWVSAVSRGRGGEERTQRVKTHDCACYYARVQFLVLESDIESITIRLASTIPTMRYLNGDWDELCRREVTSVATRCQSTQDRGYGLPSVADAGWHGGPVAGGGTFAARHVSFGATIGMRRPEVVGLLRHRAERDVDKRGRRTRCHRAMTGMPALCRS